MALALPVEPQHNILPVVAVAHHAGRRHILGEVPRVHDAKLAVFDGGPGVDLALATVALVGGTAVTLAKAIAGLPILATLL